MSTFNAGAIEATLTLDRSPFSREMKAAQQQANRFSQKKISPKLDIDGLEKLAELAAMIEMVDSKDITIDTKLKGEQELATLAVIVNNLDGKDIDLNIDVNGYSELLQAAAVVEALDGSDIDIDLDSGGGISRAVSGFSRMQAIVLAILVVLPLLAPMVAVLSASLVGLVAGLVAAGGALGAVGLGVAPTVKSMMELNEEIGKQEVRLAGLTPGTEAYTKQQEKINNLQREMNTRFGIANAGLDKFRESWEKWTKATEGPAQEVIGYALVTAGLAIEAMIPIFEAAAPVIRDMFFSIGEFLGSGEGKEMIDFFATFGVQALQSFIDIGGNLLRFLGNLFDAFAPFGGDLLADIEGVTAAWADWARGLKNSEGFQKFMEYVAIEGPKVWDFFVALGNAIINIGVALAPLGSISLDVFTAIFNFIGDMDPAILGAVSIGFGVAATAILGVAAAMAIFNFVAGLNPFVLIAIAVIALVAAVVYLWNTNEGFRTAVIDAWNAIVGAVQTAIAWIQTNVVPVFEAVWAGIQDGAAAAMGFFQNTLLPIFRSIWDALAAGWQFVSDYIIPIVMLIVQIVVQYFTMMWTILTGVMNMILTVVTAVWGAIWGFISPVVATIVGGVTAGFNIIRTIITSVMNVIMAIVRVVWGVISGVFSTSLNVIRAIVSGVFNAIRAIIVGVLVAIRATLAGVLAAMQGNWGAATAYFRVAWQAVWNTIKAVFTTIINTIKSVLSAGLSGMRSTITSTMNNVLSFWRTVWNSIKSIVQSVISNIRGFFAGAGGWLVGAGRAIIQGLINGIRSMVGSVRSAVSGVLSAARNLLPFSPAKEGPFSGQGWTLYSGRSIVSALAQGMKDEVPGLRSSAMGVANAASDALSMDPTFGLNRQVPTFAGAASAARTTNVYVNAYNPLPERSSVTAVREVTRLGQLGVLDG